MNENKSMGNCIQDFIQYEEENSAIIEICLNTLWQEENVSADAKTELIKICKGLGSEIPDLQIKGFVKDLATTAGKLIGTSREKECMKYCCNLLSINNLTEQQNQEFIYKLGDAMHISNLTSYMNYYSSIKQLNS